MPAAPALDTPAHVSPVRKNTTPAKAAKSPAVARKSVTPKARTPTAKMIVKPAKIPTPAFRDISKSLAVARTPSPKTVYRATRNSIAPLCSGDEEEEEEEEGIITQRSTTLKPSKVTKTASATSSISKEVVNSQKRKTTPKRVTIKTPKNNTPSPNRKSGASRKIIKTPSTSKYSKIFSQEVSSSQLSLSTQKERTMSMLAKNIAIDSPALTSVKKSAQGRRLSSAKRLSTTQPRRVVPTIAVPKPVFTIGKNDKTELRGSTTRPGESNAVYLNNIIKFVIIM